MTHKDILEVFKKMFKIPDDAIHCWFRHSPKSIRVRFFGSAFNPLYMSNEVIFTYISKDDWRLETVKSSAKDVG